MKDISKEEIYNEFVRLQERELSEIKSIVKELPPMEM